MSFNDLELSKPILKVLTEKGYETPSPIQAQSIPHILNGREVMAAAQTGTGKTAAFTLPILELLFRGKQVKRNHVRALILTPTRELAAQVEESVATYGKNLPLTSAVVFGGVKINPQMMKLRRGVDILVATPGRLLDLYSQGAVKFDQLDMFVLDEADRMLDMGFIHDIRRVMDLLPAKRQNLLFSATFSDDIRELARGFMNDPAEITVAAENATADKIKQIVIPVDRADKKKLVVHLIKEKKWEQVLIFIKTKHGANILSKFLSKKNIPAAAIHGDKSQGARTRALADFKSGEIKVLVATDIAARGIDINELPQIINFDLPHVSEDYVHRIGRTARAGASGHAYSLVEADNFQELCDIERLIQLQIERLIVPEFAPEKPLPDSPKLLPPKKKKPKKNKSLRPGAGGHSEHRDGHRTGGKPKRKPAGPKSGGRSKPAKPGTKGTDGKPVNNAHHFKQESGPAKKKRPVQKKRFNKPKQ